METFGKVKKEWLKQFLELPHGIPSHDTFGRVLSVIDPREFERCLLKWVNGQVKLSEGEVIALDGKTLRRSHDKAQEQEAIEIVSAWAVSQRLTLGQVKVADGSNEITAVPEVLKTLNVEGCIVTVDALNTPQDDRRADSRAEGRLCDGAQRQPQASSTASGRVPDLCARGPDLRL